MYNSLSTINDKLSAIILAGGKSSRMGQDKALIPIEGVPLLRRIALLAQTFASQVYIITPWIERYQAIIPLNCHLLRETGSYNPDENWQTHGPLIGFTQALAQVKTEWVLLLACDLPNLTEKEIKSWLDSLASASETAIALLPRHPKGWEPLCGFYRCRCLPSVEDFIAQGGRSFQGWLRQQLVEELPISDRQVLYNCNTPDDLTQLENNGSPD